MAIALKNKSLNKVWGLEGCSPFLPAAYESLCQVWFLRVDRALGLKWRSGVVLHDSWWLFS